MEIFLTHLQINYPIWFQFLDIRYQSWEFGCFSVCFPLESQVTLGITQQVLDPFARSGPRGKSKVAAKRLALGVLTWMHLASQIFTESNVRVLFSFVRHDLRLLLCDDFKDYPRRGKFTQAAELKDSMSKAVSPCNSADITFKNLVEQIWLRKVYIDIYHAWQLHVLLGCCWIHFSHLTSLNISACQHSHEATHGFDEDPSTNGKLRLAKA